MNAEMNVVVDLPPSKSASDSSPLAMDAVYDALRSNLPQLRQHDRAIAELSAALEICADTGDEQAVRLLSDMRRAQ